MTNPPSKVLEPSSDSRLIPKVLFRYRFALGLGYFALFFTGQGIHILAVPFYQMTLGVNPFLLGVVMAVPMLLGSSIGPLAGHLSDSVNLDRSTPPTSGTIAAIVYGWFQRYGRRRPFIFFAAWGTGICYGLVWMVPEAWGGNAQLLYLAITATLFYICAAFFTVPLNGLCYDITSDYHQRTRVMGFTAYFLKFASLLYQWVFPLAQLAVFGGILIGVRAVGWGLGIMVFGVLGMIPALLVKEHSEVQLKARKRYSLSGSLRAVTSNPAMLVLIVLTLLQMGGAAFAATMDYYLLVYFVHGGDIAEGAFWKAALSTAYALVSIACVPLVTGMSVRFGKLNALKLIYVVNAVGGVAKWFLFTPGAEWMILLDAVLCGAVWTAMVVLIPSMIADLSHEHQQKGQSSRAGVFASVHGWTLSISSVIALLLSGLSLSLCGFDANLGAGQPPQSIYIMRILLVGGTIVFSLLPLLVLVYFRIQRPHILAPWGIR